MAEKKTIVDLVEYTLIELANDSINKIQEDTIKELDEQKAIIGDAEKNYNNTRNSIKEDIEYCLKEHNDLSNTIKEKRTELESLGFFAFGKKKALQAEIDSLKQKAFEKYTDKCTFEKELAKYPEKDFSTNEIDQEIQDLNDTIDNRKKSQENLYKDLKAFFEENDGKQLTIEEAMKMVNDDFKLAAEIEKRQPTLIQLIQKITEPWEELNTYVFGNYKGKPLEWYILEDDGDAYTLLAKNGVEYCEYTTEERMPDGKPNYDYSLVREFLNKEFYQNAFSESEKKDILVESMKSPTSGATLKDPVVLPTMEQIEDTFPSYIAARCHCFIEDKLSPRFHGFFLYDVKNNKWIHYCSSWGWRYDDYIPPVGYKMAIRPVIRISI